MILAWPEDRDRAAELILKLYGNHDSATQQLIAAIQAGEADDNVVVQSFAAHRISLDTRSNSRYSS